MEGVPFRPRERLYDRVLVAKQPSLHFLYGEPKENIRPGAAAPMDFEQLLLESDTIPIVKVDNHNDCGACALKALSIASQYSW